MTEPAIPFISTLALSLQRGLLGHVLPEIRAVGVSHAEETIVIYCIVDGEPGELLIDEIECAAAEVIADAPDDRYGIETHFERVDSPARYNKTDPRVMRWAYARYEDE